MSEFAEDTNEYKLLNEWPDYNAMRNKAIELNYEATITMNTLYCCNDFGGFALRLMSNTVSAAESHSVKIWPEHRGKKLGYLQHQDRLEIAKAAGLKTLIALVRKDNIPELKILTKMKWTKVHENPNSNLQLWTKDLT